MADVYTKCLYIITICKLLWLCDVPFMQCIYDDDERSNSDILCMHNNPCPWKYKSLTNGQQSSFKLLIHVYMYKNILQKTKHRDVTICVWKFESAL